MQVDFVDIDGARLIDGGVAVVVDVMRAYTVAAWALHLGAKELLLVDGLDEAVVRASTIPGSLLFKDGGPDERFDLHNSPRQLLDLDVLGRTIVQRTTAGTRAAVAARNADTLLCASFVCAQATADAVRRHAADRLTFVVSGGPDADEDLACAELVAAVVAGSRPDPEPYLARARLSSAAHDLFEGVRRGFTGVTDEDVPMCLELDRFDFAMTARARNADLVLTRADARTQPE